MLVGSWKSAIGFLRRHSPSFGPPKERDVEALGLIQPRGAQSGSAHRSEQAVHGGAFDPFDRLVPMVGENQRWWR